jgi:hypothetical protein
VKCSHRTEDWITLFPADPEPVIAYSVAEMPRLNNRQEERTVDHPFAPPIESPCRRTSTTRRSCSRTSRRAELADPAYRDDLTERACCQAGRRARSRSSLTRRSSSVTHPFTQCGTVTRSARSRSREPQDRRHQDSRD